MLNDLRQDIRYGVRVLRRAPGYTAVTVVVLGIGIGAAATLFGAVNGVLRRPLPYRAPERLVALGMVAPRQQAAPAGVSAPDFTDWRSLGRTLEGLAAYRPWGYVLNDGEPERVLGARVSANLFSLLGVRALRGRVFHPDEERPGHERVALLSEELWRRRFGADDAVVGGAIRLNDERYVVVGVVPAGFALPGAELWTPLAFQPYELTQRGDRPLTVVGRLGRGATLAAARADLRAVARALAERPPEANAGWEVTVTPLHEEVVGGARTPLVLLFGATCTVLLIACANLANLVLARGAARRREMAMRAALGASRGRVVRQLAAESLLAVAGGGALGVLLAVAGTSLLARLGPEYLPRSAEVGVDATVLAFALVAMLAAGAGLAAIPAREVWALDLSSAIRDGAARRPLTSGVAPRDLLVAGQVAMALLLLVGGGLLARSFVRARAVDLGFAPAGVLSMTVSLPGSRYPAGDRRAAFFRDLARRVEALPGVRSAGLVSHLPLAGGAASAALAGDVVVEGRPAQSAADVPRARLTAATPGYFRTVGIRVVRGRAFDERDRTDAPPVVLVDEALARHAWPDGQAIGRRVRVGATVGADTAWREVVGVVASVRSATVVRPPEPTVYVPHAQTGWPTLSLVVRTAGDPAALAGAVRAQVLALDPAQPVYNVRPLEQVVARALATRRFQTLLLGSFAAAALLLAVVGVYGVLAFAVAQRTRELGIRIALGARRGQVRALVLRQALARIGAGLAIGGLAAAAGSRLIRSVLFEVSPWDPAAFAGAVMLLTAAGLAASYLPARRATTIDPMLALRRE